MHLLINVYTSLGLGKSLNTFDHTVAQNKDCQRFSSIVPSVNDHKRSLQFSEHREIINNFSGEL